MERSEPRSVRSMSHGGELKRVEHYLTCVILLAVELDLSQNKLEGEIPNGIFVMTSLGKSAIEGTQKPSKIRNADSFVCCLCKEHLRLQNNLLTGTISRLIGDLSSLRKKARLLKCVNFEQFLTIASLC
jgi:hypothetical protein